MVKYGGTPVSPGIALGLVYVYRPFRARVEKALCKKEDRDREESRFLRAMEQARAELSRIIASFPPQKAGKAKIFTAHREILEDEEIIDLILEGIQGLQSAEYAVFEAYGEFIGLVSKAGDEGIASRSIDFQDVRDRLLRILSGMPEKSLSSLPRPVVVVAHELLPSETATLDREKVLGIIGETGGVTSHTAILASSYDIPAVLGVANATTTLQDGQQVGLDAFSGEVFANPDEETTRKLKGQKATWENQKAINAQYLTKPAQLADGTRIEIGLNIASADQVEAYAHADFVGLFRTEFLYMQGSRAPIEEEQLAAYRRVLEHAGGKPVTLRTLDIGGDKTLPYLELPKEANPFLGRRALRLCLDEPELFRTQLRAALRASVYGELWIMVPMVGSLDDIRRVKTFFRQVKDELTREGAVVDENVRFGIMIEIPAIAMVADIAAQEVDFASIGTNDLCQYLCAVDRMNPKLEDYYQSYSPAMVRVIGQVASAFRRAGKPLSVCGEMAGDSYGAKLLAGLGVRKLSVSPSKVASVKAALAQITLAEAQALAEKSKAAATQQEVVELFVT